MVPLPTSEDEERKPMKLTRIHNKALRQKLIIEASLGAIGGVSYGWSLREGLREGLRCSLTIGEIGQYAEKEYHYDLSFTPEEAIEIGERLAKAGRDAKIVNGYRAS
jgi:hypothetical protein